MYFFSLVTSKSRKIKTQVLTLWQAPEPKPRTPKKRKARIFDFSCLGLRELMIVFFFVEGSGLFCIFGSWGLVSDFEVSG